MSITGTHVRMARAALRLHQQQLADELDMSWATIQRVESHDGIPNTRADTLERIQSYFETKGFKFRPQDAKTGPAVAAPKIDDT